MAKTKLLVSTEATGAHEVQFNNRDKSLVADLAWRWARLCGSHGVKVDLLSTQMDISAANGVNGNPRLGLDRLMSFDDANFAHDMAGIQRHLNRETGKLEGCFLPRCARPQTAAEKGVDNGK